MELPSNEFTKLIYIDAPRYITPRKGGMGSRCCCVDVPNRAKLPRAGVGGWSMVGGGRVQIGENNLKKVHLVVI